VFIGIALTAVFLIALAWLAQQRRNAAPLARPIRMISPADQAVLDSPLVVRFTTSEPLALHPSGWGTDKLHLHARVGAVKHMPAAADITRTDSVFTWTLTAVPRGMHPLKLGWADRRHRELSAGATPTRTITIR
jgi:hypothetical protein